MICNTQHTGFPEGSNCNLPGRWPSNSYPTPSHHKPNQTKTTTIPTEVAEVGVLAHSCCRSEGPEADSLIKHRHLCTGSCVLVNAWSQVYPSVCRTEDNPGGCSSDDTPAPLGFLTGLKLTSLARLAQGGPQKFACFCLSARIPSHPVSHCCLFLAWVLRIELRIPRLPVKHFILELSYHPSSAFRPLSKFFSRKLYH